MHIAQQPTVAAPRRTILFRLKNIFFRPKVQEKPAV
jgi:hypothetical protein